MKTLEQSLRKILNAGEVTSQVFIELESGRIDPCEQSFCINDEQNHARLTLS